MIQPTYLYYEEIDSTNNECKRRIADGTASDGLVISAGTQTAGRGRSGHGWTSRPGTSIATSMVFFPKGIGADVIPRVTLLASMAVAEAVEQCSGLSCAIKWPNDVLLDSRKICGILTEMEAERNTPKWVVVGIGVNVHEKNFASDIRDKATSIDLALSRQAEREKTAPLRVHCQEITEQIWKSFAAFYDRFEKAGDLSGVLDNYNARLINIGKTVRVLDPLGAYEGLSGGIDREGRLLVEREDGSVQKVDSGEVSVRGLYGYV